MPAPRPSSRVASRVLLDSPENFSSSPANKVTLENKEDRGKQVQVDHLTGEQPEEFPKKGSDRKGSKARLAHKRCRVSVGLLSLSPGPNPCGISGSPGRSPTGYFSRFPVGIDSD